jgi:hypothetical protein
MESTIMVMRSRDLPPNRSLDDGRDHRGVPEGKSRSPAELLDNLRLRLSQLPENHPSAFCDVYRDTHAPDEAARHEQCRRDSASPLEEIAPPESSDELREPGRTGVDQPQGDGQTRGSGSLGELIRAVRDTGEAIAGSADGLLGDIELSAGSTYSEPYRPWFMSGEAGTPWFAAGGDFGTP